MNIRKIAFLLVAIPFVFATHAYASGSNCAPIYGGGYQSAQSCSKISIVKKVQKPGSEDFVDGLSSSDPKYTPGQQVKFQLIVTNDGSDALSNIDVVDTFPAHLQYVAGPGNFDKSSNTLTIHIDSLNSGDSQTFVVVTKLDDTISELDKGFLCLDNTARVSDQSGTSDTDDATVCVERVLKVYPPAPVQKTPSTGPVDAALPMLFGMAGAGAYLTRKTRFMVAKKRGGVTK